jgi:predicted ATPase
VASERSDQLLTTARGGSDTGRLLEAHHARWATLSSAGESTAALTHAEHGVALYDPVHHRSEAFLYGGHDAGVCARYHLALIRWLLGYPERALTALRDAADLSEPLAHPLTTTIMVSFTAWVHYLRGDNTNAREHARRNVALSQAHGFTAWNDSLPVLACIEGDLDSDAWDALRRILGSGGRAAWRNVVSFCLLSEAFARLGEPDKGLQALGMIPEQHRRIIFAPEIERVRGVLLLGSGESAEAESCFHRAIEMARQREERSFELRAATSLARLLEARGKREEARETLAPVYGWFTEGFDTKDLREARALLDVLA